MYKTLGEGDETEMHSTERKEKRWQELKVTHEIKRVMK